MLNYEKCLEKMKPWDVAAGSLIVEEAGGAIYNLAGHRPISIVAANRDLVKIISQEIDASGINVEGCEVD